MIRKKAYIGIDLGGTNIKSGLTDSDGHILTSELIASPVDDGASAVKSALLDTASKLLHYAEKANMEVVSIGVGSPGGIDSEKGIVLGTTPNIPDWKGTNLKKLFEDQFHIPIFVDNDANLFLLAEHLYGAAKGYNHVVGLTIGTGIGGALIINGEIYRGSGFVGAEIGHMPIVVDGKKCKCGLKGCLECYANATALVKSYRSRVRTANRDITTQDITTRDIFQLASKSDPIANEVIDNWCEYLSTGIAACVNLLNPQLVVLGGGVAEAGSLLRTKVESSLQNKVLPVALTNLRVKIAKLGNKAGLLGGASLGKISNR
jgi:glucokinase